MEDKTKSGLSQYTLGVNKSYDEAVLKALALKDAETDETGEPIPGM
ncbi:MAG: hypothetical protein FWF79_08610 [Defluviitaleaceae bacterium]|nr:hypothetical protein [Defluviitaleaceae bacterium]